LLPHRILRHLWRLQILMQIELGNLAQTDESEHSQDDENQTPRQLRQPTKQNYRHPTDRKKYYDNSYQAAENITQVTSFGGLALSTSLECAAVACLGSLLSFRRLLRSTWAA